MFFRLILVFIVLIPFQWALEPIKGVDLIVGRVIIPLFFLFWLTRGLIKKKIILPWGLSFFFLISFFIITILSLLEAQNLSWGIRKIFFLFSFLPFYFVLSDLIASQENKKKVLRIIEATVIGGELSAMIGIVQFGGQFIFGLEKWLQVWQRIIIFFLGHNFGKSVIEYSSWLVNLKGKTVFRAIAFFPDPHIAGFYWEITFFLALGVFFITKKKFYLYSSLIILVSILLTFSRGAYLGLGTSFFIGIIYYLIEHIKTRFTLSGKKIGIIFVLALVIIFLLRPFQTRFMTSFDLKEGSNSKRLENWKQAVSAIGNHPWLGVGLGNYSLAIKPSTNYREPIYAHNLYLDIWAELGIIGIIAWLGIIISSMEYNYYQFKLKHQPLNAFLFLAWLSFSVHTIFESPLYSVHILPLLMVLLALSWRPIDRKIKV